MGSQVPREYLLAVASGRIAVVGTKVFELSPLSVVRSNQLARLNIESGISPLCLQIHFCTNKSFSTPSGTNSSSRSTCLLLSVTRRTSSLWQKLISGMSRSRRWQRLSRKQAVMLKILQRQQERRGDCWRSLSIKFNYQINKEKDPNEINI